MLGVTRRYGADGPPGRFRRSALEVESRAQSRGEWPGVRTTCREGLAGLVLWDGGGARVEEPGCRGWRREGRGDGRGLEVGRGARVGGRAGGGMSVGGLAGGAINPDGFGGGAMRVEGGGVIFGGAGGTG